MFRELCIPYALFKQIIEVSFYRERINFFCLFFYNHLLPHIIFYISVWIYSHLYLSQATYNSTNKLIPLNKWANRLKPVFDNLRTFVCHSKGDQICPNIRKKKVHISTYINIYIWYIYTTRAVCNFLHKKNIYAHLIVSKSITCFVPFDFVIASLIIFVLTNFCLFAILIDIMTIYLFFFCLFRNFFCFVLRNIVNI